MIEKIWHWEYVDIVSLLPAPTGAQDLTPVDPPPPQFTLFPKCELVRPKQQQISTISDWIQGFTIYRATVTKKHPAATLKLLVY